MGLNALALDQINSIFLKNDTLNENSDAYKYIYTTFRSTYNNPLNVDVVIQKISGFYGLDTDGEPYKVLRMLVNKANQQSNGNYLNLSDYYHPADAEMLKVNGKNNLIETFKKELKSCAIRKTCKDAIASYDPNKNGILSDHIAKCVNDTLNVTLERDNIDTICNNYIDNKTPLDTILDTLVKIISESMRRINVSKTTIEKLEGLTNKGNFVKNLSAKTSESFKSM